MEELGPTAIAKIQSLAESAYESSYALMPFMEAPEAKMIDASNEEGLLQATEVQSKGNAQAKAALHELVNTGETMATMLGENVAISMVTKMFRKAEAVWTNKRVQREVTRNTGKFFGAFGRSKVPVTSVKTGNAASAAINAQSDGMSGESSAEHQSMEDDSEPMELESDPVPMDEEDPERWSYLTFTIEREELMGMAPGSSCSRFTTYTDSDDPAQRAPETSVDAVPPVLTDGDKQYLGEKLRHRHSYNRHRQQLGWNVSR